MLLRRLGGGASRLRLVNVLTESVQPQADSVSWIGNADRIVVVPHPRVDRVATIPRIEVPTIRRIDFRPRIVLSILKRCFRLAGGEPAGWLEEPGTGDRGRRGVMWGVRERHIGPDGLNGDHVGVRRPGKSRLRRVDIIV